MKSIFTVVCILVWACSPLRSQDIHFTLYDLTPLAFNPAETGAFYGTYRLGAIYRDQWLSITGVPDEFKTPSFFVDVPVIRGFRDNDWVGVGLLIYSDKSGSLGLQNSAFKLSAAYHFALDKKGNSVLSLGYQTGSVQKRIKDGVLEEDFYEPDMAVQSGEPLENSYVDHVGGIHFKSRVNDENLVQLGASVGHIGKPDGKLAMGGTGLYEIPMRFLAHGSWRAVMTDRFALHPSAFFQSQGGATEVMIQAVGEYLFNPEKQLVLRGGLGYRLGDAVMVIMGIDIEDLKVTLGYDLNVSRLTSGTNTFGGFEISAQFIGKIFKKPDPDPVLFCPRF